MLSVPESIKALFKRDNVLKNFRISFPNGEMDDIINDDIVKESVNFSESLCSMAQIRFGLCESSSLQFSCWHVPNIKGYEIRAWYDIDISTLSASERATYQNMDLVNVLPFPAYSLPMGRFIVDSAKRDDVGMRTIVAYSADYAFEPTPAVKALQNKTTSTRSQVAEVNLNVRNYVFTADHGLFGRMDSFTYDAISSYTTMQSDIWNVKIHRLEHVYVSFTCTKSFDFADLATGESVTDIDVRNAYLGYIDPMPSSVRTYAYVELTNALYDLIGTLITQADFDRIVDVFFAKEFIPRDVNGNLQWDGYYSRQGHAYFPRFFGVRIWPIDGLAPYSPTFEFNSISGDDISSVGLYRVTIPEDDLPTLTIPVKGSKNGSLYSYADAFAELDMRALLEDYCEMLGFFVGIGRDGKMKFYKISRSLLFPANDLFPADDLYPCSEVNTATFERWDYISALFDERFIRFGSVMVSYTDSNNEENIYTYEFNQDKAWIYDELLQYDVSDNIIIVRNSYSEYEIESALEGLIGALEAITYSPAQVEIRALPYMEVGDFIWVSMRDETIAAPILMSTITGIQDLRESITAK